MKFLSACVWFLSSPFACFASTGSFKVDGHQIKSPDGSPFEIKGANVGLWVDNSRAEDVHAIKNLWKFNAVRVFLRLDQGTPETIPSDSLLDRYVQQFTGEGNGPRTVVIFEFHDKSGGFYRDGPAEMPSLAELVDNWKRIANRYKDNPWVWYNPMNEPGGDSNGVTREWLEFHKTVIAAIRSTGATAPILCDGQNFASEETNSKAMNAPAEHSAILTYGLELLDSDPSRNLVFGWHLYTGWNYGPDKIRDFITRVKAKKLALLVGEFAATTGNSLGNYGVTEATRHLLPAAREEGVGRMVWHYWGWDGNALTTSQWGTGDGSSISPADGSRPVNLTWLGEMVWDDNHDLERPSLGKPLDRFGWKATASSNSAAAWAAIDGDGDTGWELLYKEGAAEAPPQDNSDWFQVDLGTEREFSSLELDTRKTPAGFPRDFRVWISNDGIHWGDPVTVVEDNKMAVVRVSFPPKTARHVKVAATRFGKDWGKTRDEKPTWVTWCISDLNLYRPGGPSEKLKLVDEISRIGWVATASRRSPWDQEWEAGALDDNEKTRWASGAVTVEGDSFVVDMGKVQMVGGMNLTTGLSGDSHPLSMEVSLSTDNAVWTTAAKTLARPVTKIGFKTASARFIKVTASGTQNKSWWAIHEARFYRKGH